MKLVYERVKNVREYHFASKRAATRKLADKPTRFQVENFPSGNFIAVPQTSSEKRQYIPIGFMNSSNICSDKLFIIPAAQIYHFGILTSSIHMTWLRTVAGRLESRYRYSKDVVYNNFVWIEPTNQQKKAIETSAQAILDIRASLPDSSFAELYDEVTMPYELRQAHWKNDLAVAKAYGWEKFIDDEPSIAVALLKLYKQHSEA